MTRATLSATDVDAVRGRIARAHQRAAVQFRELFVPGKTLPEAHLELLAAALIEEAAGVGVHGDPYVMENDRIIPRYENFVIDRSAEAIFEYWLIVSEITGSAAWRMTAVIAGPEEYDAALRRMQAPQIVRALVGSFLPSVDIGDDGTAFLEVTVYTRAEEERIERRQLFLDAENEFHFHARELIAEGRGGVRSG